MAKKSGMSVSDQVNDLRSKGYSENEATMISLKRTRKDKKKQDKQLVASSPMREDYPYGTRIDLQEDELDKLGIADLPEAGETMHLDAEVKVIRSEESTYDGEEEGKKTRRSVCLQITKMCLE